MGGRRNQIPSRLLSILYWLPVSAVVMLVVWWVV